MTDRSLAQRIGDKAQTSHAVLIFEEACFLFTDMLNLRLRMKTARIDEAPAYVARFEAMMMQHAKLMEMHGRAVRMGV